MTGRTGWVRELEAEEYHSGGEVSASFLKTFSAKSPAHAQAERLAPPQETPALRFGRAVHARILEPEAFEKRYAIAPRVDRRTKLGRELWEIFQAGHPNAEALTEDEAVLLDGIAGAVESHPLAPDLLQGGEAELSGFWTDPEHGLPCRCRPDYARLADGVLIDLKTAVDASPAAFARSIATFGYAIQAAHYAEAVRILTGERLRDWLFIVVEKTPPFAVAVYRLDSDALRAGHAARCRALHRLAECMASDRWPGYSEHIEAIGLPAWAIDPEDLQ